jgi:ring-1,2-phenylacetyl-CoA epoxidase subunit PaaC
MTNLWTAPDAPVLARDPATRTAVRGLLLACADDELILGHRHAEWTGFAPDIESDVAMSSIAQEELGHARVLYEQIAALDGTSADRLAFGRAPDAFRNAVLVERPNGDWAFSIVRAWLYDHADTVRLQALAASPLGGFASLARTLLREEKYHVLFSDAWLERLAKGGEEAGARVQRALDAAWPDALGLFEATPDADHLAAVRALAAGTAAQQSRWEAAVRPRLGALGLIAPEGAGATAGGRAGRHLPDLGMLLTEMTSVWRSDPEARW